MSKSAAHCESFFRLLPRWYEPVRVWRFGSGRWLIMFVWGTPRKPKSIVFENEECKLTDEEIAEGAKYLAYRGAYSLLNANRPDHIPERIYGLNDIRPVCAKHDVPMILVMYDRPFGPSGNGWSCPKCVGGDIL